MNTLTTAPDNAQFLIQHPTAGSLLCDAYTIITSNAIHIQEPYHNKTTITQREPFPEPPTTLFGSFSIQIVPVEP